MTVFATDNRRYSNLVKKEQWPESGWCREAVLANEAAAKEYVVGTALGRVIAGGVGAATATTGNTGNGTMGAITVTAPAKLGKYRLVITAVAANAGTFLVIDPEGQAVGTGTVASAFSEGGLAFTLADGATDFALGDSFDIRVTGSYKYKIAVETATDGSRDVAALVLEEKSVPITTDTRVLVMVNGDAQVSKFGIVLDSTYDNATKLNQVYASLEAKRIQVLDAV